MKKIAGMLLIAMSPLMAQEGAISAERIREHTRFLSSDLLEGRAPEMSDLPELRYTEMVFAEATTVMPLIASDAYHRGGWRSERLFP